MNRFQEGENRSTQEEILNDDATNQTKYKKLLKLPPAYCQGFNFIVALLLSVFDGNEEHALR